MAGKYQAYGEFKESCIEWVGHIPTKWTVEPLFSVTSSATIKNVDGKETNVLSLSYGRIIQRDVEENYGLLPESFNTYQLIKPGDIILRLTDLQNDKRSLRVGHAKEHGIITSAYLKLTACKQVLNHRYFYRLLHSYDTTKVFYGMGGGLRQSMKFDDMRRLPILLPPYEEQEKIAEFLDHETGKIDALIEKQKRLIALLKEKRQAVISHAVTKGLNPDAPMKDSGVEWLGDIPEHWEVKKLKFMAKIKNGRDYKTVEVEDGFPVIGSGGQFTYASDFLYDKKSVLLGRKGTIDKPLYIDEPFWTVDTMYYTEVKSSVDVKYLYYLSLNIQFDRYSTNTALPSMTQEHLANFSFSVSNCELERQQIAQFLDTQTSKIDALISKAESAITLMQERRTALISAAVTGKIDVRNWEAPQETQEEQAA